MVEEAILILIILHLVTSLNNDNEEIKTDTFVVKANDGSLDSADTTITFNVKEINTAIPQVLLTSSATSITETSNGSASLTVNAVLISNDFLFSKKRHEC